MKSEQARFILQAFRPGTADERDPHFAEALAQVERDPELKAWFAAQCRFDEAVRAKLREVPVPEGLRDRILAGKDLSGPVAVYRRPGFLAMAAVLLIFVAVGGSLWQRPAPAIEVAQFEAGMIASLEKPFTLDLMSQNLEEVKDWLASHTLTERQSIPATFENYLPFGCRTFEWNQVAVVLVCFNVEGNKVHLFMTRCCDLPGLEAPPAPFVVQHQEWSTARWKFRNTHYLAISNADPQLLRNLLL